jgi:hypothetical protein
MKKYINYMVLAIALYNTPMHAGFDHITQFYFPDFIQFIFFQDHNAPEEVTIFYGLRSFTLKQGQTKKVRVNNHNEDKGKIFIEGKKAFKFTLLYPRNIHAIYDSELTTETIIINSLPQYAFHQVTLPRGFSVVAYLEYIKSEEDQNDRKY